MQWSIKGSSLMTSVPFGDRVIYSIRTVISLTEIATWPFSMNLVFLELQNGQGGISGIHKEELLRQILNGNLCNLEVHSLSLPLFLSHCWNINTMAGATVAIL